MPIRRTALALAATTALLAPASLAATNTGPWTLTKVTFEGNAQVTTSDLEAALPIQPGSTIDADGLKAELAAVGQVYQSHNVGVSIGQKLSARGKKATLTYELTEQAPQAPVVQHIGITADTVSVTGNKKVPTADILAAAKIAPGSQIDNAKLAAAQAAIVALYHKKNVGASIGTAWTNNAPQHVALVFKVTESD